MKFPLYTLKYIKEHFLFVKEGFRPTDFLFVHLFNQQKETLKNLKAHLFLKELAKLKKQAQLINSIPQNCLVEPDSKVSLKKPLPLNYNGDNYQERRHAYYFLLKHKGYLWKTGMKWADGFYRSALDKDCICQRTDIESWVKERNERNWKYLINYLKKNYQVEYLVQTARCQCSKHLIFKHTEPIASFQTYFSYYDYRQQRQRKIVTGSCQSKGKLLSGVGSKGKSLLWMDEKKLSRKVITSQEGLLSVLHKFYVCREPKPNKVKLWIGNEAKRNQRTKSVIASKENNLFVEKSLFPEFPWSFDKLYADSRLVRKIRSKQKQEGRLLPAGERKRVRAKYIKTNQDFIRTKENDSLDKIRLEVEGQKRDYFFNSHHRRKYSEKLTGLRKGEELSLVLLGGNSLTFVDRVIC
jgi:hypothetical protein